MPVGAKVELSTLPSGDSLDTTSGGALRVAGRSVLCTSTGTTDTVIETGAFQMTGSSTDTTFTTAFVTAPKVFVQNRDITGTGSSASVKDDSTTTTGFVTIGGSGILLDYLAIGRGK